MDEKVTEKVLSYIDGLENRLSSIEGFAASEVPLYVQELLNYHFYYYSAQVFGSFLICAFLCWLLWWLVKTAAESKETISAVIFWLCLIFIPAVVFFEGASKLFKISIAPRVYLVDHITDQLKAQK